jgi:L-lactate dehydrogenase complex protein LldE
MKVGLFVPCYIDQLYPGVAVATLELLEKLGCSVGYPLEQTCCGQPLANAGFERRAQPAMHSFVRLFGGYDYVVTPSGSCALHVRHHYGELEQTETVRHVRERTLELCEFLTSVLGVERVDAHFPYRVGLHSGCHGLRGLRLGQSTELGGPGQNRVRDLLAGVRGLTLVDLVRPDECCGFGGTFAVAEEAMSVRMGEDRLGDHLQNGAEVITSADMSCLMHLEGIARRRRDPVRIVHVAEILNGSVR